MSPRPPAESPAVTDTLSLGGESGPTLSLRSVEWRVIDGPQAGRVLRLSGEAMRIGSAPDNDMVLLDRSVSRHHAQVTAVREGFLVRDLGSRNGTFLEGHRIKEAFLREGNRLKLAGTTLVFRHVQEAVPVIVEDTEDLHGLLGRSLAMRELHGVLRRLAPTELTAVLMGETGTGKEMAARAIHQASRRAGGPFVVLDCSAMDPELVSSELFGHEVGAFTGAVRARAGCFEVACGGTVFIDELGELPLSIQAKLLRALERREVKRLGSEAPIPIDCRLVAATHRSLLEMVENGTFREDLYYRFAQVVVRIPPLRDRREDIPLLARAFLEAGGAGGPREFAPEALAALHGAEFRGNVRELRNVVERARALAPGDRIRVEDLGLPPCRGSDPIPAPAAPDSRTLGTATKEAILQALKLHHFHRARTAAALGISLPTLRRQMRRHGITVPERG